jgi:hypothetical protein
MVAACLILAGPAITLACCFAVPAMLGWCCPEEDR